MYVVCASVVCHATLALHRTWQTTHYSKLQTGVARRVSKQLNNLSASRWSSSVFRCIPSHNMGVTVAHRLLWFRAS